MHNSKTLTNIHNYDINPELNLVKLTMDIPEIGASFDMDALELIDKKYRTLKMYEHIKNHEDFYSIHLLNEDIESLATKVIKLQDEYGIDKEVAIKEAIGTMFPLEEER